MLSSITMVAVASKNPLFLLVLRSLAEVLMRARMLAARLPETPRNALYHHRRLFAAIEKRSVCGSRSAMEEHLREAETTLQRALAAGGDRRTENQSASAGKGDRRSRGELQVVSTAGTRRRKVMKGRGSIRRDGHAYMRFTCPSPAASRESRWQEAGGSEKPEGSWRLPAG
jgi:hypothetical protein